MMNTKTWLEDLRDAATALAADDGRTTGAARNFNGAIIRLSALVQSGNQAELRAFAQQLDALLKGEGAQEPAAKTELQQALGQALKVIRQTCYDDSNELKAVHFNQRADITTIAARRDGGIYARGTGEGEFLLTVRWKGAVGDDEPSQAQP